MVMLVQFVRTRWLSKYGMLRSLVANKDVITAMCASDDEECKALHGRDLLPAEWKVVEVEFHTLIFAFAVILDCNIGCLCRKSCLFSNLLLK
jgi:hypothetical protein